MKKIAIIIAAALSLASLGITVGAENSEISKNENGEYVLDIEKCTSESECIVLGTFEEKTSDGYKFKTVRMLKGDIDGKVFYVTADDKYGTLFQEDCKYVLYLDKQTSVYNARDIFVPQYDVVFAADEKNTLVNVSIDGVSSDDIPFSTVASLTRYTDTVDSVSEKEKNYIRSESFDVIYNGSDYIVKAKVEKRIADYNDNAGIYELTLTSSIKGNVPEKFTAVLFDKSVREGSEYYFLFGFTDGSDNYILSSKKSIYSAKDTRFSE